MKSGIRYISSIVAVTLFAALPAYAQFDSAFSDTLTISFDPLYPQPGQTVLLKVRSAFSDLDETNVVWRGNGTVIAEGVGATSATVVAGSTGQSTDITVSAGGAQGAATLTPVSIDLLWEASSYTPPFFSGRSLPSAGSVVRVLAMPHFPKSGGGEISAADLVYTWRRDGALLSAASGRGKSSILIPTSPLSDDTALTVSVATTDKRVSGESTVRIPASDISVQLYEDHPLFGMMYHRAFSSTNATPETEITLVAVPFFAPVSVANDPRLQYEWTVNRSRVTGAENRRNAITINGGNATASALIELALSHATNFFISADASWIVTLKAAQRGGVDDPFRR